MRILRGKSNLEVSSQGFAWFVVGLVIASFVGGAIRTALTSDRIHKYIVNELRARFPQQQFQVGQTEVLLSRGMWPGLGLRVKDLTFRQDVCGKLSFVLEVPNAVLPVDIFSLRKGKIRLGRIELRDGKLRLNYKPCQAEFVAESSALTKSVPAPAEPKKPIITAPSLDWKKASEHLDAIELTNFTLTYERNLTWKMLVHGLRIDLDEDDLSAQGELEIQKTLASGALSHLVNLEAQGDNRVLQWGFRSEFKEGLVQLKGSLDLNTHAATVQAFARQLPMKDVMSELNQMGFVERDMRLKATWLSCGVKWEGLLEKPEANPLVAKDCKVEGGYGRVDLEAAEFWMPRLNELKKPAILKVSKLQMQPLLEALGRQVLPKVLARPGIWTGELSYLNPNTWHLEGHLESVEVVFSNRSVRGKQVLEKLRTRVDRAISRIEAKVDRLEIRDGEFAGDLRFSLQDDWRNGDFTADIQKLRFSPPIQTLLTGGSVGVLRLKGQGVLQDGELGKWDGDFELEQATGAGWQAEGVQVKSRYTPGIFRVDAQARAAKIDSGWNAYPQLQTIRPEATGDVQWQEVRAGIDIQSNGGVIHSITGFEAPSRQVWRIKGAWVRDGEFNAVLSVGGTKPKSFSLTGEKGTLSVSPR